MPDASRLGGAFLLEFYEELFRRRGYATGFAFEVPRNAEYLSYLVYRLGHAAALDGADG